tara:strand:+ start:26 stop:673 length:648 start_codon:yes stop_codon:yes gene_type:complete
MRYFLLPLFILLFTLSYSQDVQQVAVIKSDRQVSELLDEIGNQELKLDVIDLLTRPALNVGYEKINDAYSSFGADLFLNLNDISSADSWAEKISVNPFYRFYFLNKTDFGGEGYFAEVFLKLSYLHYERNTYYYGPDPGIPYNNYEEVKTFDIAPGVGVGRKWVNKKGWTFEYMVGFGRFLFANSANDNPDSNYGVDDYRPEGTFKGGISIGKRF